MRFNFKVTPKKELVKTALVGYAKRINADFEALQVEKKRSLALPKSRLLGKWSNSRIGIDAKLFTAQVKNHKDFLVLSLDVVVSNPLIDVAVNSSASWVAYKAWWLGFSKKIKRDLKKDYSVKVRIKELKENGGAVDK